MGLGLIIPWTPDGLFIMVAKKRIGFNMEFYKMCCRRWPIYAVRSLLKNSIGSPTGHITDQVARRPNRVCVNYPLSLSSEAQSKLSVLLLNFFEKVILRVSPIVLLSACIRLQEFFPYESRYKPSTREITTLHTAASTLDSVEYLILNYCIRKELDNKHFSLVKSLLFQGTSDHVASFFRKNRALVLENTCRRGQVDIFQTVTL